MNSSQLFQNESFALIFQANVVINVCVLAGVFYPSEIYDAE